MKKCLMIVMGLFVSTAAMALILPMPATNNAVVGRAKMIRTGFDTVANLQEKYDVGFFEFVEANPGVNLEQLYPGTKILVPTSYVLPQAPRKGIVINIAELRLYYYDKKQHKVLTFPVGIGKKGWITPIAKVHIIDKEANPDWVPTNSVRKDFLKRYGYPLPQVVAPGPNNPLGDYSMRLSLPTYLIHGTTDPAGVGKRVSAGCIRMFNQNVGQLFAHVKIGTPVNIVYEPYKAGWHGNRLFLEAHQPIEGRPEVNYKDAIERAIAQRPHEKVTVNWTKAAQVAGLDMGVPQVIGHASKH